MTRYHCHDLQCVGHCLHCDDRFPGPAVGMPDAMQHAGQAGCRTRRFSSPVGAVLHILAGSHLREWQLCTLFYLS